MQNFLRHLNDKVVGILPASLRTEVIPDRLIVRPADMWAGSAAKGLDLCDGVFSCYGHRFQLFGGYWQPEGLPDSVLSYVHGFEWLRDLRACDSRAARQQAQALIESWAGQYPKPMARKISGFNPWDLDLVGKRISLWIAHYDFFAAEASPEFLDAFFVSLYRQAQYLARGLDQGGFDDAVRMRGGDYLAACKGLLFCGLAFDGHEDWTAAAMQHLEAVLRHHFDVRGMHVSRSPYAALRALRILLEMRSALQAGGQVIPVALHDKIAKLVPIVRYFRYADKRLSLMHGAMLGDVAYMDSVLAQAGVKGRRVKDLASSGYTKLGVGRTTILFDHGGAAQHCAPLSFEMSYGRDRVFVNCGSHVADADWQDMLRYSPAHTALEVQGQGAFAGYKVHDFVCSEDADYGYAEATHDGYYGEAGLMHKRSLYLSQDGHDLRGEDVLRADDALLQARRAVVRFHLHPKVMVSLLHDGREALLRLPNGIGWRFQHAGGFMQLEASVYAGEVDIAPVRSQQLVVTADIVQRETVLKWALRREGL